MKVLKRTIAAVLIVLMAGWLLPGSLCHPNRVLAQTPAVTRHPVESTSTPDETLTTAAAEDSNWMLWSLLGVALVGGLAALAGGGGGGDGDGGDDDDDTPTTGTIPVEW